MSLNSIDKSATGRERPWRKHKISNISLIKAYKNLIQRGLDYASQVRNLTECANILTFAKCTKCDTKKLQKAYFCKSRFCFICNWRKSLKAFNQFITIARELMKREPEYKFLFLTLTIKNCPGSELEQTYNLLNKSFRRLTQYKRYKESIKGFYRSIENTYNPQSKEHHPHIHAVLAVDKSYFGRQYIKKDEWITLWKKALKVDYDPSIDIQKVKNRHKDLSTIDQDSMIMNDYISNDDIASAGAEIAKYAVTMSDIINPFIKDDDSFEMRTAKQLLKDDVSWQGQVIHEMENAFFKKRFTAYGGILKEIYKELNLEDNEDDLVHVDSDHGDECTCPTCQSEMVQLQHIWSERSRDYI